ncbi:3-dehydroquinate synthase, partial [Lasius niger]
ATQTISGSRLPSLASSMPLFPSRSPLTMAVIRTGWEPTTPLFTRSWTLRSCALSPPLKSATGSLSSSRYRPVPTRIRWICSTSTARPLSKPRLEGQTARPVYCERRQTKYAELESLRCSNSRRRTCMKSCWIGSSPTDTR